MAKFHLHIPQPCSEKWEQMQPTERGAFCSSCQKEVVDFSGMSDTEIREYFHGGTRNSCGRFRSGQLNRTYQEPANLPFSWKKWLIAAAVGVGAPTLAWSQHVPQKPDTTQYDSLLPTIQRKNSAFQKSDLSEIKGVVIDSASGEPLPGTAILMLNSTKGTVSDVDGAFTLGKELLLEGDYVQLSFIGFTTQIISLAELHENPVVRMVEDIDGQLVNVTAGIIVVGGVQSVRWYSPRGLWRRMKGVFSRH